MRGDIFEFVGLFFVPDNFIVMMQQFCRAEVIERLVVTGEDRHAAVAVLFAEIAHAFSGNIGVLFRAVNLAFHVLIREQIRIENHLANIAEKTDSLCPVAAETHAANQRAIVNVELKHFVHFFEQMRHIMLRMARAVANQPHVRVDELQLQHFLMVTWTVRIKTVQINDHCFLTTRRLPRGVYWPALCACQRSLSASSSAFTVFQRAELISS
ncbi:hypothetical protein D3C72_1172580 [compost metagenome]